MKEQLIQKIKEADMVLVGIGEEFEMEDSFSENPDYQQLCGEIVKEGMQWVMPYVKRSYLMQEDARAENIRKAYRAMEELLTGKNYFVISTCMDGLLRETGLKRERIVEPCGTCFQMQCEKGCKGSVTDTAEQLFLETEACTFRKKAWKDMERLHCPICGAPMEYNSLYAEHYLEEGYSEKWNLYTKWLQGTLNKKLCILELGAGMLFAGVLRFRFEKITGLNQKAELLRVHENLYQLPEEISNRGLAISKNSVEFMAKMAEL